MAIRRFKIIPPRGTVIRYREQAYRLISSQLYTRLDNQESVLLIWETRCPECQVPFEIKTGLSITSLNRRCQEHKAPGKPVKPKPKKSRRTSRHG